MYEAIIYFNGPLSRWAQKPDEREVIARKVSRWKILAEGWAIGRIRGLSNCAYVVKPRE